MGRDIGWGTTYVEAAGSFRAPLFYDSNNTVYYTDPASTSNLNAVNCNGNLTMVGAGSSSSIIFGEATKQINVEGYWMMFKGHQNEGFRWQTSDGTTFTTRMQLTSSTLTVSGLTLAANRVYMTTGTNLHLDSFSNGATFINYYAGTGGTNFCNGVNGVTASVTAAGAAQLSGLTVSGPITANSNSNYSYQFAHGNNSRIILPAGNNGASNGDVTMYSWVSEPGVTWTGGGIARNRYNTTGFPRVNSSLSSQMIRFDEGNSILFYTGNSAGTFWQPFYCTDDYAYSNASLRAPIFYDTNDTAYYVDPAGTSLLNVINAAGNITAYYSDERLKTKLGNIPNALNKVLSLNGFYFEANETAQALGYTKKKEVGVSAQEVEAVLPEIIAPAPIDNKYKTLDYSKLVPLLIEAIKEQQSQIEELKLLVQSIAHK